MDVIHLSAEIDGARIDKYIADNTHLTRNSVVQIIEQGSCLVNDKVIGKNYRIKIGDGIQLMISPPREIEILPQDIPLDIRYEDDDVVVVNKPRGMVVHPAHGHEDGTLVNALMFHCHDSLSGINGELRPGIVHRIDKNTSGLLMVAKNDFAHVALAEQIKSHTFVREYEAVVRGQIIKNGTVNAPIGRDAKERKRMAVTEKNSKSAVTHYEVIRQYKNSTHMRLILETGRTHQIRVHMAYIGHPILGDDVYGSGKPKWLGGQCLHAKKLGFVHPRSKEYIEINSELPNYFIKLLDEVGK